MNTSYKSYALLLAVAVATACPARAMDSQVDVSPEQQVEKVLQKAPVVWYKKRSTQKIASAVVVATALAYVIAVRMNKVAGPTALLTALFCSQVNKIIEAVEADNANNDTKNTDVIIVADNPVSNNEFPVHTMTGNGCSETAGLPAQQHNEANTHVQQQEPLDIVTIQPVNDNVDVQNNNTQIVHEPMPAKQDDVVISHDVVAPISPKPSFFHKSIDDMDNAFFLPQ